MVKTLFCCCCCHWFASFQDQSEYFNTKILSLTLPLLFFPRFSGGSDDKESTSHVGDLSLIPGLGRSPGGEHGNPFQYSYLENPHRHGSLVGYKFLKVAEEQEAGELAGECSVRNEVLFLSFSMELTF